MPRCIGAWRRFLGTLLVSMLLVSLLGAHPAAHAATTITVTSPGGTVQGIFSVDNTGTLQYRVSRGGVPVIEPSPLGITLDSTALGNGVTLGTPTTTTVDETYPTRGVHPVAVNHYTQTSIPVIHAGSGITYTLEVRAYDDGLAYRYNIPARGAHTVTSEQSSWKIPDGTTVWIFENSSDVKLKTYSGSMTPVNVNDLPTVSPQGPVQGAGLTLELPNGGGYAVLSEAALANYSGMRLEAIGNRTVRVNFTEGASGFSVNGPIMTPWRFTLTTADLNGLVNSDLVTNLNPAPDPALYGDTSWIKPGRSVWSWPSSGNTASVDQQRAYINAAAQLGFEYTTIDNGWETAFAQNGATAWDTLKTLCDEARAKGVGVFVWKNSNALSNASNNWQDLRAFLDQVQHAGAAGVKIDYFYAESKSKIELELAILRETAARHLLVNFHGISKPTGEQCTFPNQLTREAVRGLEVGLPGARHDAALPFTRFVLGPADYTPLAFTNNYAEQLATLVIYTSPLQVISASTQKLLNDSTTAPALDVVKAVPTVWDETRVLPPSQIGQLALFARRSGDRWFVAGINGDKNNSRSLHPLNLSFLGALRHDAVLLTSGATDSTLVRQNLANVSADTPINIDMLKAGGFVMMLTPHPVPTPASTTTSLTASPNPATAGDMVTLVATVSATTGTPTGNVQFHDGDNVLGTAVIDAQGRAVLTTAALTTGSHTLVASYAGDSSFAASTSAPMVEQIVPVPDPTLTSTTTSLTASPNPATAGDMVTLVAMVSAATGTPSGSVQFRDGDNVLGTASVDEQGRAVLITTALTTGSHTLVASYAGDSSFAASTSAAVVEQIVSAASEQRQIFMPMIAQP